MLIVLEFDVVGVMLEFKNYKIMVARGHTDSPTSEFDISLGKCWSMLTA